MSSIAKYEKLIDLIVNEQNEKAHALFHDIVVETSREIYETLLNEDATSGLVDEVTAEEEGMDGMMEGEDEFVDDEEIDGDYDVDGEDGADDEELDTEIDMDADEMADDEEDAELEDRVVDLEDKLDELMAEFESMMADEGHDEEDIDVDMDKDGEEEDIDIDMDEDMMMENVELKQEKGLYGSKISQDYTDGSKKGPVAANSGQRGMASKPVNFDAGGTDTASGTKAPAVNNYGTKGEGQVKDADKWNNRPGQSPKVAKTGMGDRTPEQYGDAKSKAQGKAAGAGGESVKQDNRSVVPESRRSTKRRI